MATEARRQAVMEQALGMSSYLYNEATRTGARQVAAAMAVVPPAEAVLAAHEDAMAALLRSTRIEFNVAVGALALLVGAVATSPWWGKR
jgi:hypothetical protein